MRIHRVSSLVSCSYLLETAEKLFLVDAGMVGTGRRILKLIGQIDRTPEEVSFALVTHAHADHFGGLAEVQEASGCAILCHPAHVEILRHGRGVISPGLNAAGRAYEHVARLVLLGLRLPRLNRVEPVVDGTELHSLGLPGRVLHTPGHSSGDLTLVLDDGSAFVGDLVGGSRAAGLVPPGPSIMAVDESQMLASWQVLLESGARVVYPSHGQVVDIEEAAPALRRAFTRLTRRRKRRSSG